jgi:hypothetical protein
LGEQVVELKKYFSILREIIVVPEILTFSGQERAGSSKAFYPGFLSVEAIRQSQRILGRLLSKMNGKKPL